MERHEGLLYLQYFYFLGSSRIKHITLKLGLVEPWLKSNLVLRIKSIEKRVGFRDNLIFKNSKYANDTAKLVILW
jgi:hypothetical protein